MAERILVTGGAGCIGSELIETLVARGHHVIAVDNLSSGWPEHLAALRHEPNFSFVEGDVREDAVLDRVMPSVETVFHLAANSEVRAPQADTARDLEHNVVATHRVLEAMRRHGVRRLAFASSSTVYGLTDGRPVRETSPTRPISLYGATKLAGEGLSMAFQHLFGMRCWIFRFANVVGGRVRRRGQTVVSDFIRKLGDNPRRLEILGNGDQAKSYLLVGDCIDAMLHAMARAPMACAVYNLGAGDSLSVKRIADMVVEAMGLRNVEYAYTGGEGGWPGDVPRVVLDVTALRQLGWSARHTSEEAVALAIRAMLAPRSPEA